MADKGKTQKSIRILLLIFSVNLIFSLLITPASAAGNEFLGFYEYTLYVDGYGLKGTAERYRSETAESISTYFGTYQNAIIHRRTNRKLSHSYKGSIEILDDKAYYDHNYNLRKTESRWKIRLTGYYTEDYRVKYEYGNYVTLQDTPTVFEQTYTIRYYKNGAHRDTMSCRDYVTYEAQETITVDAGSYKCDRFKSDFYEDGPYAGYSKAWINVEDGTLIKQQQYDASSNLIMTIILISETKPIHAWEIALWVLGAIGIVILAYAVYNRRKKRIVETSPKTKGKIKPIMFGSTSSYGASKGTKSEYRVYNSRKSEYGTRPKMEYNSTVDPPFTTRYQSTNPYCPLCSGKGEILTASGLLPCPFCRKHSFNLK